MGRGYRGEAECRWDRSSRDFVSDAGTVNILVEVESCDLNAAPPTDSMVSQPAPAPAPAPDHTFTQNNDKQQGDIIVCHLA